MNLTKIIRSNDFAVGVAIASMIAQSKHTFQAFINTESLSPGVVDISFAVVVAVIIDLAVLFYTLRNRKDIAIGAMVSMIVINTYSYWITHEALNMRFFMGVFFSIIIPVSVMFYSEEVKVTRSRKKDE